MLIVFNQVFGKILQGYGHKHMQLDSRGRAPKDQLCWKENHLKADISSE